MQVKNQQMCNGKQIKLRLILLAAAALIVIALFIMYGLNSRNYSYNLYRRIPKIIAICITGISIAVSTVIFQTITNNRILTPSILGMDSIYTFVQTAVAFLFGIDSIMITDSKINFLFSVTAMTLFSILLYKFVFTKNNNIFILLLVGIVIGTLFRSLSSFMKVLIDPSDFILIQSKLYASFNNINIRILAVVIIMLLLIFVFMYKDFKVLDVMNLGRDISINLGVEHDKKVKKFLVFVALLVSISTALVGPVTFLGILVSNLSYEIFKTYKHSILILGSSLISIIALVYGQFLVERILNFSTTVSIIINFIGGSYFIYLLLKEVKGR